MKENEFRDFGITKKDDGVFIIKGKGLLFFNKNVSKLEELELIFSNIQKIDGSIKYLSNILMIDLGFNKLTLLPDNFSDNFTSLKELNLSGNQLKKLSDNFSTNPKSLEKSYFMGNKFTSLPKDFSTGLKNLKTVSLSSNEFKKLPDSFSLGFTNLKIFGLAGNQLTTLPDNFSVGLKNLYLRYNSLPQNQINKLKNKLPKNTKIEHGSGL